MRKYREEIYAVKKPILRYEHKIYPKDIRLSKIHSTR